MAERPQAAPDPYGDGRYHRGWDPAEAGDELDELDGRIDRYDPDDRVHEPHPFGPMWDDQP